MNHLRLLVIASAALVACEAEIGGPLDNDDLREAASLEADSAERGVFSALPEADPLTKCAFDPMQWWRGPKKRDVTFVAFGDAHAEDPSPGCPRNKKAAPDQNLLIRAAINSVDQLPHLWPKGPGFYREGKPFDHIRGVVIAGDLTQAGSEDIPTGQKQCREYTVFRDTFGRCGDEGRLRFPVYEGYGNHDFPVGPGAGQRGHHPVVEYLDRLGPYRPGKASDRFLDPAGSTGHHAWRWDDIWFVSVDLKPGFEDEVITKDKGTRIAVPHTSRRFLKVFLQAQPRSRTRQIVIVSHYPPGSSRIEAAERRSFCKLINNARHGSGAFANQKLARDTPVAAFIHGHTHHAPQYKEWRCPDPYDAITIPTFDVGTAFYNNAANGPGQLHFTIFRLGTTRLEAVGVSAPATSPTSPWTFTYKRRMGTLNPPD